MTRTRAQRLGLLQPLAPAGTSLLDIILACREQRCLWDPWAPWEVAATRTGRRCWERRQDCLNGCTSVKVRRVSPDEIMEDWGQWRNRPRDWKAAEVFGLSYGGAMRHRIARQLQTVGIRNRPEEVA